MTEEARGTAPCAFCGKDVPGQWTGGALLFPEHCDLCARRSEEGRCLRCGNWPQICGHDLTFKERAKDVGVNYIGWSETR